MAKLDRKWLIIVTLIVIIVGTLLHFVYKWSKESKIVGYVAPVNESVWEHLKLLVFPLLLAVAVEIIFLSRQRKSVNNPWTAILAAILIGMVFIVATFYTYTGAFTNKSKLAVDIGSFIVAAVVSSLVLHSMFKRAKLSPRMEMIAFLVLLLIITLIAHFSYNPPNLPLFKDSLEA